MKRMLINATQPEELRVAMVDGQYLYDLDIEVPSRGLRKGNVYKGCITRVEPSLEAAFVDYGAERHGFLPFKEISRSLLVSDSENTPQPVRSVRDLISEGTELIVQVEKEERGNKGAALTTFVSLAGRYLVLMPNNPRAGGISRRVEGDDRQELREILSSLDIDENSGVIVRTAGVGKSEEELQWDLNYLRQVWDAITHAADERQGSFLIYQESNVIIRAIRDYFRQDIGEILIDDEEVFRQAHEFMGQVMRHNLGRVKHYQEAVPLFSRFQIETQIESAFGHSVRLPSGGAIVIDYTEALISIDINSSRATKGGDIEETAFSTNLEAADEIARQLRLRDLGGLIVIDFIDMTPQKHQRDVENRMRDALKRDRARVQLGRISRFGLFEMSRQRIRPSLGESSQQVCNRCNGQGSVRSTESLALSVLRIVEEDAIKENTGQIVVKLPIAVATFMLNEKREAVHEIETRHRVKIVVVPDAAYETPNYALERIRNDDATHAVHTTTSYGLTTEVDSTPDFVDEPNKRTEAAVQRIAPLAPPPVDLNLPSVGLFTRIWRSLFGTNTEKPKSGAQNGRTPRHRGQQRHNSQRRRHQSRRVPNRNDKRSADSTPRSKPSNTTTTPSRESSKSPNAARGGATRSENTPKRRTRRGGRSRNRQNQERRTENKLPNEVSATGPAENNAPTGAPNASEIGRVEEPRAKPMGPSVPAIPKSDNEIS